MANATSGVTAPPATAPIVQPNMTPSATIQPSVDHSYSTKWLVGGGVGIAAGAGLIAAGVIGLGGVVTGIGVVLAGLALLAFLWGIITRVYESHPVELGKNDVKDGAPSPALLAKTISQAPIAWNRPELVLQPKSG